MMVLFKLYVVVVAVAAAATTNIVPCHGIDLINYCTVTLNLFRFNQLLSGIHRL